MSANLTVVEGQRSSQHLYGYPATARLLLMQDTKGEYHIIFDPGVNAATEPDTLPIGYANSPNGSLLVGSNVIFLKGGAHGEKDGAWSEVTNGVRFRVTVVETDEGVNQFHISNSLGGVVEIARSDAGILTITSDGLFAGCIVRVNVNPFVNGSEAFGGHEIIDDNTIIVTVYDTGGNPVDNFEAEIIIERVA